MDTKLFLFCLCLILQFIVVSKLHKHRRSSLVDVWPYIHGTIPVLFWSYPTWYAWYEWYVQNRIYQVWVRWSMTKNKSTAKRWRWVRKHVCVCVCHAKSIRGIYRVRICAHSQKYARAARVSSQVHVHVFTHGYSIVESRPIGQGKCFPQCNRM